MQLVRVCLSISLLSVLCAFRPSPRQALELSIQTERPMVATPGVTVTTRARNPLCYKIWPDGDRYFMAVRRWDRAAEDVLLNDDQSVDYSLLIREMKSARHSKSLKLGGFCRYAVDQLSVQFDLSTGGIVTRYRFWIRNQGRAERGSELTFHPLDLDYIDYGTGWVEDPLTNNCSTDRDDLTLRSCFLNVSAPVRGAQKIQIRF